MALLKLMQLPEFAQATAPSPIALGAELRSIADSSKRFNDDRNSVSMPVLDNPSGREARLCAPVEERRTIAEGDARSQLQHFKLLDAAVDIQPLLAELDANAQYWLHDTSRQDRVKVQRETHSIYLRSAVKPFPPGVTSSNDVHESRCTAMAKHFPRILGWTENVATSVGGELGRVTVVRLAPHGKVYRHIDRGEYYRVRDRYHLVLKSPMGSILGAGDEWLRMQEGELWWFNNKVPHEAHNESGDWRVHLIFDVLPCNRLWHNRNY
jgi:hypothetical protein